MLVFVTSYQVSYVRGLIVLVTVMLSSHD